MKLHNVSKNRSTVQMVSIASLLAVAGACAPSTPVSPEAETEVVRSPLVGGGAPADFSASVSGTLSQVVGSFPTVSGVTSEQGTDTADEYSLQVNSNKFDTPACLGTAGCKGWRQFIYSTRNGLYIETWLLGFGAGKACPTGFGPPIADSSGNCARDSLPRTAITPSQPISNLGSLTLTAQATAGGTDIAILALGGTELGRAMEPDNFDGLNFQPGWNQAEFNIFGDTSSSPQATFALSPGPVTIGVQLALTGSFSAPTCIQSGTTGERNNLTLVPGTCTPSAGPPARINFFESSIGTIASFAAAMFPVSPL
jgi:hypothetical protein